MDILLIATYTAICVAIFKIFRIPLNKWTVPTAVLGGIVLIGALLLLMNYNHPYAEVARQYYRTTPVISFVRGRVIEVPVKANTPLKEGDVLFRVDPAPYEFEILGLEARLQAAVSEKARQEKLLTSGASSSRDVEVATANVDDLEARLGDARFNLEQTTVRAPTDGFITQLILRPGMMALPFGSIPLMTYIHKEPERMFGWFRQNSVLRLDKGDEAEVAFDSVPGVVFKGEVESVVPAISEGQLQPTGTLLSFKQEGAPGRAMVIIKITDPRYPEYQEQLPGGVFAQIALYTDHFHHLGIIRRVLIRMSAWMNYVFPMH
jgi:multidrug resistance efflux pump